MVCGLWPGAVSAFIGGIVMPLGIADGQSTGETRDSAQDSVQRPAPSAATRAAASESLVPVGDGGVARLVAAHKGNVVLVNVWATWCAPCLEELPHLLKLETELSKQGFRLITISADEPEEEKRAIQILDSVGMRRPRYIKKTDDADAFINAVDPQWSGALPALFLYDREGKRIQSLFGETDIVTLTKMVRDAVEKPAPSATGTNPPASTKPR